MTRPARFFRNLYHKLIPPEIRQTPLLVKAKECAYTYLLGHDVLYDANFFVGNDANARRSAGTIADSIVADLSPHTVVDVGCGTGALLLELKGRGCATFGLEYADAALECCRNRGLQVTKLNLEKDEFIPEKQFDVAVSTEVAEHLPEAVANRYVKLLSSLAETLVFTAARPGQGGEDHVNEQLPGYWILKFNAQGLQHDEELSQRWQRRWTCFESLRTGILQGLN